MAEETVWVWADIRHGPGSGPGRMAAAGGDAAARDHLRARPGSSAVAFVLTV